MTEMSIWQFELEKIGVRIDAQSKTLRFSNQHFHFIDLKILVKSAWRLVHSYIAKVTVYYTVFCLYGLYGLYGS